ncbi:MAG: DUF2461 domain-containing protein [Acidobacteria bacterium]|nr:DUF2461 domain-containing protein [Acidobacteriota bacterium]
MFSPRSLTFLRALKKHNDRDWFRAHREEYERDVHAPMVALVERLAGDLATFAPELVASPRVSLYRIYRDTRFSADKSPFKTHAAAVFPCRGLGKHEGAGLYIEISPARVLAAGGMYMPQTTQLQLVREHLASNFTQFRSLVEAPSFRKRVGTIEGEKLRRVPRGFPADHPAAEYLKFRQFLAGREYAPALATSPRFYSTVVGLFRQLAPVIRFLNEPLI